MASPARAVTWEAPEHNHTEKSSDWFWALGIIALSGSVAAFFFGNFLFALLILVGASVVALIANKEPEIIPHAVTTRGLRIGEKLYPYSTLEAYYIDEDAPGGPELLARSEKMFMHMIVMPIPEEHIDDIEEIIESRLPEEFLEEPLLTKILEFLGF